MHRFLLGPRWLALHLAVAAAIGLCVVLGRWQLSSYEETRRVEAAAEARPVALSEVLRPGTPLRADQSQRAVRAAGSYLVAGQRLVVARPLGERFGSWVMTPLVLDGDAGTIAVVRGWVDEPDDPATTPPPGRVVVTGRLRALEREETVGVLPAGGLATGEVVLLGSDQVAAALPAGTPTYDAYVLLTGEEPAVEPRPQRLPATAQGAGASAWQNLSYTAQWWLFAGAAAVFWVSVVRAELARRRPGPTGAPAGVPAGDPAAGDPAAGDPAAGDPAAGDPAVGDVSGERPSAPAPR